MNHEASLIQTVSGGEKAGDAEQEGAPSRERGEASSKTKWKMKRQTQEFWLGPNIHRNGNIQPLAGILSIMQQLFVIINSVTFIPKFKFEKGVSLFVNDEVNFKL